MAKKLLLTCTIDTKKCSCMTLKDSEERKSQYLKSVNKYLTRTNLDLIIAENSNADLTFLKNAFKDYSDRIEYLSFFDNEEVDKKGKGHGERITLRYALLNSEFLKNENFFFKVSGRYFSSHIESIINQADTNNLLCVSRYPNQNRHIPTVFLGSNKELFLSFFTEDAVINDNPSNLFERIYFNLVNSVFSDEKTKNKIFWLDPILYEEAMSSNGEPITYF